MLFSVIIPTYNRLDYLPYALGSVWEQTLGDFEIIVVDDGSTDGTREYLASLGGQLKVVRQMNRGPGAARNAGTMQASGDYLAFLDSDDRWLPWGLSVYAQAIRMCKSPVMVSASVCEFMHAEELAARNDCAPEFESFPDYFSASQTGYYVGAGMGVYRADAFRNVGGFIEQNINCEDHDLALRLGDAGVFVQIRAPVTLAYHRHAKSATSDCSKTLAGVSHIVKQEHAGVYPGQQIRACARQEIITRHLRPVSLQCLKRGLAGEAWQLFRDSFRWHVRLRRWKFILGFVCYWLLSVFGYKWQRRTQS